MMTAQEAKFTFGLADKIIKFLTRWVSACAEGEALLGPLRWQASHGDVANWA